VRWATGLHHDRGDPAFRRALHEGVAATLSAVGHDGTATTAMWGKILFWLTTTTACWLVLVSGVLPAAWALPLCAVFGLCMAGTGFNIGHDAIHGAISRHRAVNGLLAHVFDVMGANSRNWARAHNFAHHTWTNVAAADCDIEPGPILRFHPHGRRRAWHRFQHLYAFALYGLAMVAWVFVKDFKQVAAGDPTTGRGPRVVDVVDVVLWKAVHFALYLGAPALWSGYSAGQIATGYLTTLICAGLPIALVFQLPHLGESTQFPVADASGHLPGGFHAHQLRTTANFATTSWFWNTVTGGQNHQIEHHLFPKLCHVHLPTIAPQVRDVATAWGEPYRVHARFRDALLGHIRTMKRFGRGEA
jgi:linoleoyl-CoA desaturase